MSRYLNPPKTCLLLLIQLYRNGSVPLQSTVPVLSFISSQIVQQPITTPPSPPSITALEALLSVHQSEQPGRSLYDQFLQLLWSLEDLTTFQQFFQDLTAVTQTTKEAAANGDTKLTCSPTSPIGQFVRRCHLESVRLPFADAYQLWEDFVLFREPTKATYLSRNPDSACVKDVPNAASSNLLLADHMPTPSPVLVDRIEKRTRPADKPSSQDDLEKTIHFQLQQLQKFGTRVPDEMKAQLRDMIDQGTTSPSDIHFIKFFDAWRTGAYSTAIELLHRYFDYTMDSQGGEQNVKTYHQYALLHLAILHADFGCYEEALSSMNECIATARENQDARCLQFSLSWLSHLRRAYPDFAALEHSGRGGDVAGDEEDIITFLQQKSVENKDWATLSSSLLSQAELTIQSGGSTSKALQQVYQSGYLNNTYTITSMMPSQMRLHASIQSRLGQMPLAEQYCSLIPDILSDVASKSDILNATLRDAYTKATAGEYTQALELLAANNPTSLRTLKLDNTFLGFAAMINMKRALHHNDLFRAETYLSHLLPLRHTADAGLIFESHLLEIDLLLRQSNLSHAHTLISSLIASLKTTPQPPDVGHTIKLLILKARVFALAGRAQKGFSIALRAAASAHNAMLLPLLWEAVSALGAILLNLGEFAATREIVEAVMPQVLECGDGFLVGVLYGLLADALVGLAGVGQQEEEEERNLALALGYVERALEAYRTVEDLDGVLACLARKALVFRHRGEEGLAGEMERLYDDEVARAGEGLIR